jgi:uncharacterized OB-fold protein
MTFERIFYVAIIIAWFAGVTAYIFYFQDSWKKRRKKEQEHKRKRKIGKRCPQCRNIIDYRRPVCQHCAYKFPEVSEHAEHGSDPRGHKKRRGKKCPKCGNTINYSREGCQHCGYKFTEEGDAPPPKPEAGSEAGPDAAN